MLDFWFGRADQPGYGVRRDIWFKSDAGFDRTVGAQCGALHDAAAAGRLDGWASTPHGSLALLILLDQVPRNLFRGTPRAFATDPQARAQARAAVAAGFDRALPPVLRGFVYLPFEHSRGARRSGARGRAVRMPARQSGLRLGAQGGAAPSRDHRAVRPLSPTATPPWAGARHRRRPRSSSSRTRRSERRVSARSASPASARRPAADTRRTARSRGG